MNQRPPEKLPDPWLFDSESLLRELDRCRELVLDISIAHPHQTHFDINIAVDALWNLRENLRYLLALHREGQRQFARQQTEQKAKAAKAERKERRGNAGENVKLQGITLQPRFSSQVLLNRSQISAANKLERVPIRKPSARSSHLSILDWCSSTAARERNWSLSMCKAVSILFFSFRILSRLSAVVLRLSCCEETYSESRFSDALILCNSETRALNSGSACSAFFLTTPT